jgi:hypothetical protein
MIKEVNDYLNPYYFSFLENPQVGFLSNPYQIDHLLLLMGSLFYFLAFRIDHHRNPQ